MRASRQSTGRGRTIDRRGDGTLPLVCGIDWATAYHDVGVIDVATDGFARLAQAGDSAWHLIPVGIESDCGPWLAPLRASPAHRAAGDRNRHAQRHPFEKFLGQLHDCLSTGRRYNEHLAFPPPLALAA
jgi:hypothetical protein